MRTFSLEQRTIWKNILTFSNRLSWIFAFWLFQFIISGPLFIEVLQFTIINLQTEILFIWTHLEPNWPICLLVYSHITTVQIGVINQCVPPCILHPTWSESESHSVLSDFFNPMDCIVHGILQARMLEWVAFPFSRGSSQPRDWTQVSHIAGGFFTNWATREAQE